MKKTIIIIPAVILLIIAAIAFMTVSYSATEEYKSNTLPDSTNVNGIDCSGLDYEQADTKISREWNKRYIIVTGSLNEKLCEFTDFGCTYDIRGEIQDLKKNHMISAALNHYLNTPFSANIPMIVSDYSPEFKERVLASDFLNNENATETSDAYVDLSSPDFPIVHEKIGTKPDAEKFFKDVINHIQSGELNFMYDSKAYSIAPKVTADDPELLEYREFCKKYLDQKITYLMGEETFTISAQQLSSLMKSDMSGKADRSAVEEYVSSLAEEYDNVGSKRSFTTISGKNITVDGGTYGWTIDQEKETEQLTNDINSHKNTERKPVYSFESYGEYTKTMGSTYVDVDFTQQKVRFYEDGTEKFSCSVVTGNRARGDSTPDGTYYILNRLENVIMRGDNDDGTRYEEPANYWMGVTWNGIGLHDSSWRTEFGGDIWKTNGSHGCINMPKNKIPQLFNMVEVGMPVVMHY